MKTLCYLFLALAGICLIASLLIKANILPMPSDPITFVELTQTFTLFSIAFALAEIIDRGKLQ